MFVNKTGLLAATLSTFALSASLALPVAAQDKTAADMAVERTPDPARELPVIDTTPVSQLQELSTLRSQVQRLKLEKMKVQLEKDIDEITTPETVAAPEPEPEPEPEPAPYNPSLAPVVPQAWDLPTPEPEPEPEPQDDLSQLPAIAAIIGVEGNFKARLVQPGGAINLVETGQVIPGGYEVTRIARRNIVVRSFMTGKDYPLFPVGSGAASSSYNAGPQEVSATRLPAGQDGPLQNGPVENLDGGIVIAPAN